MMKKITRPQILFAFGVLIIVLMIVAAVFAPWLAPQDPDAMSLADRLQGPSWAHPLGLDENGSDVFSKLVYGARVSLGVAWSVILVSCTVGLIFGPLAGYFGGWVEQVLMRFVDMVYAFQGYVRGYRTPIPAAKSRKSSSRRCRIAERRRAHRQPTAAGTVDRDGFRKCSCGDRE